MQKQEIADKLHARFMKATAAGEPPWLAVADEAVNCRSLECRAPLSQTDQIQAERNMALDAAEEHNAIVEQLTRERDNWEATAAQHLCNEDYYRSLVVQIGEMFGLLARMCDDGVSISEDILYDKVPELVQECLAEYLRK